MSKYKVGDKVVVEILGTDNDGYYEFGNDNRSWWWFGTYINETSEPLSTYTEPLQAKIRRQAAEITRLRADNKNLKEKSEKQLETSLSRMTEITKLLAENKELKDKLDNRCDMCIERHEKEVEQARAEGAEAAWELARKIVKMKLFDYKEIFNSQTLRTAINMTYPEAAAKVEAWENAKEEIKVGDVYKGLSCNFVICGIDREKDMVKVLWDDLSVGARKLDEFKNHFTKTGRHIDIEGLLKQIGEE